MCTAAHQRPFLRKLRRVYSSDSFDFHRRDSLSSVFPTGEIEGLYPGDPFDVCNVYSTEPVDFAVIGRTGDALGGQDGEFERIDDTKMPAANLSALYGKKEELPEIRLVHKYFEEAVKSDVEKARKNGVHFKYNFTSYYEINEKADIMARNLLQVVPKIPEVENQRCCVMGVDIEPCPELLITLLAILKCGATYLPLDPLLPPQRIKHIVSDAKPVLIIVESKVMHLLHNNSDVCPNTVVVDVHDLMEETSMSSLTNESPMSTLLSKSDNEALAAVIYTSGSTGVPKGVLVRHVAVINRLLWQWETYPWQEGEVGCFKTAILFVDSMVELFSTTLKLVPMVVAERGLVTHVQNFLDLLEDFKVTRLVFVPSLLRNFISFASMSQEPRLPDLRLGISNSETLPPRLLIDFFDTFPGKRFANFYGSTETMADVTWETYDNPRDMDEKSCDKKLSIGVPVFNTNLYILDEGLDILPLGEVGEICISGFNLARGYMDASKSAAFVANPHSKDPDHAVLYKTGDYGKIVDGRIIYFGRQDMQVKIRGHRINTSEIERVVGDIPGVQGVAILCHTLSESTVVVVAYYTVRPGINVTKEAVIDACKKSLPSYMIPKPLRIDQIPLQRHTGKIERQALKRIFDDTRLHESKLSRDIESLDETSVTILKVISRTLNLPETSISLSRSFVDFGGNSVNAIETIVRLREQGFHITIDEFANSQSIREMIAKCEPVECASPQLSVEDRYEILPMAEAENHEEFIGMFTECFVQKEPLTNILQLTREDFKLFAKSAHDLGLRTPSIVVRRKQDKKIIAADILCDFLGDDEMTVQHHEKLEPITGILDSIEKPVRQQLIEKGAGPIMLNFLLSVDVSLPSNEQLKLVYFMEERVLDIAKRLGFKGVIGNNTNSVTQNICEHYFGYQVLATSFAKDFVWNGEMPFTSAPDDYCLKLLIKYV
ncbi:beta-alanyl-bioamine nonribosomal peptide synthetase ebony-like [Lineus longissimus]|uniref:beta-alanyl-bioamine nonribosomal peptide synthetase ebony-like n=1 Tax=Lineus longissimus TaxID=88925 RepID=UPI002B4D0B89